MPIAADIYYNHFAGGSKVESPALILIHGAGGNYLHWHPNLRRIAGFNIYALDLPGHGKSPGKGYQTISGYAESVLEWMGGMGMRSAVLVGHSMGSAIAMTIALDHPGHAVGLVLIGTGVKLSVNAELLEAAASQTTYHKAIDNIVKWSFHPETPSRITEQAAQRMEEIRPSVLHGDLLACNVFNESERIERIYKPTLVVCGEGDRMTPPRFSQYVADHIAGARLVIVPDAGHMVIIEQPLAVADAIADFVPTIRY